MNIDNNLNGGCLLPNEEIVTKDGLKMICDIKEGDFVISHDGLYHEVKRTWEFNKPTYYVSLANGEHIECANTHRFLINKNKPEKESSWKTAEQLHDGDEIFVLNLVDITREYRMAKVKISRIFKSGNENKVIDLTVAYTHTYVSANGVINHNSSYIF